ncbi:MAG: EAL domain-containing protein [Proteobacteria bacterium]|nr:GGDEF domain-containing response regulator [Pseudomonadota bacterium]NOG59708.1 EAL domain-containing protein [Pseudomonadota bacterium]
MSPRTIKLLLIEDNPVDSRLLKELLYDAVPGKHNVVMAYTINGAIELMHDHEFDIIVTDLNLPDANDVGIISRIQAINSNIPIVVMSGQADAELALEIVQMGAQDYLVKGQGDGHLINRVLDYSIERKNDLKQLSYLANYDSLTGLANRLLFRERLDRALIHADRSKTLVSLFVIDLDRFKNVNDTLGHDAGDQLLVEVANRLKKCTREGDTVSRLGGDEFTIIMEDLKNTDDVILTADKVLDFMKKPFEINAHEIFVTPSIGITVYPMDEVNAGNLFINADSAMYQAKKSGRNCYRFYKEDMNSHLKVRMNLETKLRRAIERDEFVLYYQPKFNIHNNELIGAEALIRWIDPEEGMISPALFIPLAEETGLIAPITDWVLKKACNQNSEWQKQGYEAIRIAVNLSPKQFNQENIAHRIFNQIICSDLAPKYVELEITEGALVEDVEKSNEILNELKTRGIHISIDDFGTGYSSLSYLKKFPLDTLKIDQSFVRDLMEDSDDAAIVSAIIAMAKSLRFNVIAEGVETAEQLSYLAAHGCHEVQGYFTGRPVPAEEFVQFLVEKTEQPKLKLVQSG